MYRLLREFMCHRARLNRFVRRLHVRFSWGDCYCCWFAHMAMHVPDPPGHPLCDRCIVVFYNIYFWNLPMNLECIRVRLIGGSLEIGLGTPPGHLKVTLLSIILGTQAGT